MILSPRPDPLAALEASGTADEIRAAAAREGATVDEVFGPSRVAHVVRARRAAMRVVRDRLAWSYPAIGRLFGRDHTSVMAALQDDDARAARALRRKDVA